MDLVGMVVMWVWTAVVYVIWSKWTMGKESDRRQKYWERFEGRQQPPASAV